MHICPECPDNLCFARMEEKKTNIKHRTNYKVTASAVTTL